MFIDLDYRISLAGKSSQDGVSSAKISKKETVLQNTLVSRKIYMTAL